MIRKNLEQLARWLTRVVTQPLDELSRWQKTVRSCYDLGRFGARQLRQDRAQHMAAALSFRTLFGLLPVMVVATALIGMDEFQGMVDPMLESVGLSNVEVELPDGPTTLNAWLKVLMTEAADISFATVGGVGVTVMLYAAISLMVTIENCFNVICRAGDGRRWSRRVPLYWFLLTVSPLAMALSIWVNSQFKGWMSSVDTWGWVLWLAGTLWSLMFTWLVMFAIYTLFPSSAPRLGPAAAGALVAAILLEFGRRTFGAYLDNAFTISKLGGSLSLVPLFMFWVYLMWLVVLFGLEVASILQALPGRRLKELEQERQRTGLVDPAAVVVVMEIVAERFGSGESTPIRDIGQATGVPDGVIEQMVERLVAEGILHRMGPGNESVALARPPDQIAADTLLDIGYRLAAQGDLARGSSLLGRLRTAQRELAARSTLAGLVAERAPGDAWVDKGEQQTG